MHDEVIAEFRPRAEAALSFVDETVRDRPFLLGDACTIADIGCWGRMVFMAEGGFEIGNWPHLEAWAGRLKAMPGFALPYDLIPSKGPGVPGSSALPQHLVRFGCGPVINQSDASAWPRVSDPVALRPG